MLSQERNEGHRLSKGGRRRLGKGRTRGSLNCGGGERGRKEVVSISPASASRLGSAQRLRVAFEDLWQAHRRELLVHCYRMLGSWTDAEDVLQDVLLRAWRGLPRFEARASARAWLYRIATNACLTALRRRRERSLPEVLHSAAPAGEPLGPPVEEARWIQPFPTGADTDVEAVASSRESVTLAFIVALQSARGRVWPVSAGATAPSRGSHRSARASKSS
jgi:RNA polymerase sigma factor (sigma-70 family)